MDIRSQLASISMILGAFIGLGVFSFVTGSRRQFVRPKKNTLKRVFSAETLRSSTQKVQSQLKRLLTQDILRVLLAIGGALMMWLVTGWPVATLLALIGGWVGPHVAQAPQRRQELTDEIEAYSQWAEQVRDLVSASGSLYEAVTLSAGNAPDVLRPAVSKMTSMSRTMGLPAGLDWFVQEMKSPYADRLVLGMRIAWDSGARVTETFTNTARALRLEVEMRRRNEVANSRAWTQVVSILSITLVAVSLLFVFNRGFFDPFESTTGQLALLVVGTLIFGNVFWVMKLSEAGIPERLLAEEASTISGAQSEDSSKTSQESAAGWAANVVARGVSALGKSAES